MYKILNNERNHLENIFCTLLSKGISLLNNYFLYLESRPLSVPVKAMLNISEGCRSPEERMKEFIGIVWNAVKSLTIQVK